VKIPARGRAGGKVILLGEHAVVYGRPALAAGIGLAVAVEVKRGAGPAVVGAAAEVTDDPRPVRLLVEAAGAMGLDPAGLVVRVESELPVGAGLGSSAALTIALLRALAAAAGRRLARVDEHELGRRLEAIFHGHPSGVDPAAAAAGLGCLRFVRGEPPDVRTVRPAVPLAFAIALAGRPRSTGAAVGGLRARWSAARAAYEALFDEIAAVVESGTHAIERGCSAASACRRRRSTPWSRPRVVPARSARSSPAEGPAAQ
jgi:mevalonate kinase